MLARACGLQSNIPHQLCSYLPLFLSTKYYTTTEPGYLSFTEMLNHASLIPTPQLRPPHLRASQRAKEEPEEPQSLRQVAVNQPNASSNKTSTQLVDEHTLSNHHAGNPPETRWTGLVLLISALVNTLLLAFLFKAAQLDDRDLLAGRVATSNNDVQAATRLQGPARATGQLSLQSIQQASHNTPFTLRTGLISTTAQTHALLINHNQPLEIKAKHVQFILKSEQKQKLDKAGTTQQKILLSFNATLKQVELANEPVLELLSPTSTSLTVVDSIKTTHLEAAPGKPLQIQASQSNLVFQNTEMGKDLPLKVVARGGEVTLSSSSGGQVSVNGPVLSLSAVKGVRLASGLQYYDSPVQSFESGTAVSDEEQAEWQLAAHTLLAVNGFLMASTA